MSAPVEKPIDQYLPLTEATYCIMLPLTEPLHGYGIMQYVENISGGRVRLGPGTLYGALAKLEKDALIIMTLAADRKKCYQLTPLGCRVLRQEITRLKELVKYGDSRLSTLNHLLTEQSNEKI
jgi:DNA-binding PadR family transcriptional regulator